MLCAPWQSVHSGADAAAAPFNALPWMLSSNLLPMLPPGSLPFATTASLPWHFSQVATRFAWLADDAGSFGRLISCEPWQSTQLAATALPPLRAAPCTVPAYSLPALSWQVAQSTGFSFSACGSLSTETSAWQSVHFSCSSP